MGYERRRLRNHLAGQRVIDEVWRVELLRGAAEREGLAEAGHDQLEILALPAAIDPKCNADQPGDARLSAAILATEVPGYRVELAGMDAKSAVLLPLNFQL